MRSKAAGNGVKSYIEIFFFDALLTWRKEPLPRPRAAREAPVANQAQRPPQG